MANKYYLVGWRLNSEQRKALREKGLHIYATRSWDEGTGCTLEHRVFVNHEDDVITNFAALNDNDPKDFANDFYEHMAMFEADNDWELPQDVKQILEW